MTLTLTMPMPMPMTIARSVVRVKLSDLLLPALVLVVLLSHGRCCYFDLPLGTTSTSSASSIGLDDDDDGGGGSAADDDDMLFRQFRLDIIKEKMLRGLGLSEPPKFLATNFNEQNNLKGDLGKLPVGGRRFVAVARQRRRPRHQHGAGSRQQTPQQQQQQQQNLVLSNKASRVVVFAEPHTSSSCWTPSVNAKIGDDQNDSTRLTFKLPNVPSPIYNAVLWYMSAAESPSSFYDTASANDTDATTRTVDDWNLSTSGEVWLCPCGGGGAGAAATDENVTSTASPRPRSRPPANGAKCTRHASISLEHSKSVGGQHQNRKGWSYVRLPGFDGLPSVVTPAASIVGARRDRRVAFIVDKLSKKKRPFLMLEVGNQTPKPRRRFRRSTATATATSDKADCSAHDVAQQKQCCRTGFWVDVRQLGWSNWIISPAGFFFRYCAGRCETSFDGTANDRSAVTSSSSHLSSSVNTANNYSHAINAYVKRFHQNLRPCCVARRMSHLPVVITTDGMSLNRTHISNFIVDECACLRVV